MASRFFHRVGVVAVVLLIVGALAALTVVKNRIRVTVADEEAAAQRGPDPIAVLTADVAALREDVHSGGEDLGSRMQALHEALAELDQRVAELAAAVAHDAEKPELVAPHQTLLAAVQPVEAACVATATAKTASVASSPSPATPAEVARKKSFLSFKLPSQAFAFDQSQRFAIVPSLSRVGFDAKSTLHDFSGVTTKIEGEFTANLAHTSESCSGTVRALSSSLDTGLAGRDESMREILEPAKFPELRFDWNAFEATDVDTALQKVAGVAKGTLSIHGVAREIAMPVTVLVDASKRLAIDGQMQFKMSDFGIRPPAKLGVISVEDEVTLWIALRARTLGAALERKP